MSQRLDKWVMAALFALVVLFFHNALLGGEQFYAGDTYRYFYPLKKMAAEAVRAGRAPMWNPLVHSGMPLHAAMQAAVFYPFSILFYILPFDFAYKWYVALHVLLAAAGMYALMRRWKLAAVPAVFSAITFSFSGFVISFIDGLNIFSSIAWLPVVFLLFEWAAEEPRVYRIILAGFALAAQALAGDPVSGYYTFLICGTYWFILLVKYAAQRKPRREMAAHLLVLPAAALIAFLLSYVQFGPAQELTRYSTRAISISYESATWHSLAPLRLLTMVAPFVFGNPVENFGDWGVLFVSHFPLERTLYIGMMALALIPLSMAVFKEPRVYFFATALILSLLLSMGEYTPLYRFAYTFLPMFNKFRYPVKAFFLVSFSAAILSGYGLQYLVSQEPMPQRIRMVASRLSRNYFSFLRIVGPLLFVFFLCDRYVTDLSGLFFLRASTANASIIQKFIPQMKEQLLSASLLLAVTGTILWTNQNGFLSRRVFSILALGFLAVDLLPASYRLVQTAPESFYTAPPVDSILRAEADLFRLYRTPVDMEQHIGGLGLKDLAEYALWNRQILSPNFGALFGYAYTDGYESANLLWHNAFINYIETSPPLLRPRLLGLLNVKYIVSSHPVKHPDLQLKISLDERTYLYENSRCLPRAYFAPVSVIASSEAVALRFMASNVFEPRQAVVLVDKGGPGSLNPQPGIEQFAVETPSATFTSMDVGYTDTNMTIEDSPLLPPQEVLDNQAVTFVEYSPERIRLKVSAPSDGYLVLCDAYYPRWKAIVNGRETEILRANGAVRAVAVPQGPVEIEFFYDTGSFKRAVLTSFAAAMICVAVGAVSFLRGMAKKSAGLKEP